ncbi:hypothetical protein Tco_0371368 [Tanacetum coccineum]
MLKSIHFDHQDIAYYIPKYHKTPGLSEDEKGIYKNLERRYFHEGRVVHPSYLDDQPNLCQTSVAIKFDCLLVINEQICPVFVLQFYKIVRLIRNFDETISIAFIINNVEICLRLEEFALILRIPCEAYYIAKIMESITQSDVIVLPYGMLLTRLYRHVHTTHPYAILDLHHLVDHVMIPLTEGKPRRIMIDGKRPHPQPPS